MKKVGNMKKVGEFQVISGKVMISDPCYDFGTWCADELPAVNGTWEVYIIKKKTKSWGTRTYRLQAVLKGHKTQGSIWKDVSDLGVDSGQMSIYDFKHYRNAKDVPADFKFKRTADFEVDKPADRWYNMVCEHTLSKDYAVTEYGCASSTGLGDGVYPMEAQISGKKAVAIRVIFL